MNVPVAVTGERAEKRVGSEHRFGPGAIPDFIAMRKIARRPFGGGRLDVVELGWLACHFDVTVLEVAVDCVFRDALADDFIAAPAHLPERVGDRLAMAPANLAEPLEPVDELTAIATRCTPANPVGLEQCNRVATLGQRQRARDTGEAAADD